MVIAKQSSLNFICDFAAIPVCVIYLVCVYELAVFPFIVCSDQMWGDYSLDYLRSHNANLHVSSMGDVKRKLKILN